MTTALHASPVPDALGLYLADLEAYPLLSEAEEYNLAIQAMQGDVSAKRRLIEHNLRLVVNLAKHYQHMGLDLEDLVSEGNAGLMRAVETFDPEKGRLTTYATWWIKQSIRRALEKTGRLIRLPSYQQARLARLARTRAHLCEISGEEPTTEQIAVVMGLDPVVVAELLQVDAPLLSLDQPASESDDTPLAHLLPDCDILAADAVLLSEEAQATLAQEVVALMPCLTERERQVLRLRFGFDSGPSCTLSEIGRCMGLSKERVRQILQIALGKVFHQCLCTPFSITLHALPHAS